MKLRIRFTEFGMEAETQEGNVIVQTFKLSWNVLHKVIDHEVREYLRISWNSRNPLRNIPSRIHEFIIAEQ